MAGILFIVVKIPIAALLTAMIYEHEKRKKAGKEAEATSVTDCLKETNRILYCIAYALLYIALWSH